MSTTSRPTKTSAQPPSPTPPVSAARTRLVSLDALRGFDMFWILGADVFFRALGSASSGGPLHFLGKQFSHKPWEGMAFYDLIFPLFIFIVGASLTFSLPKRIALYGRRRTLVHVFWRALILFALGMLYNGGVVVPEARFTGVLHRIAVAYAGTALLLCFFRPRTLAAVFVAILVGYWALLTFVPIREFSLERSAMIERFGTPQPNREVVEQAFYATTTRVTERYEPGFNLAHHIDFMYLPGARLYDPNGLLSIFPAIALGLLGVFAGLLLKREDWTAGYKLRWLIGGGIAALVLGWLWHLQFPVIKKIWSSSYILVAGGWSLLLLAAFYWMIDVRRWRGWCKPFVWIGMNAITLYLFEQLASVPAFAERLVGGPVKVFLNGAMPGLGEAMIGLVVMAVMIWLGWFLYCRQIFLRV